MKTNVIAALLIAFSSTGTIAARQSAPAIGYVVSLRGPWQLNGHDVKRGEGVPAGAHLVLAGSAEAGESHELSIILLNNLPVGCASADTCRGGVTVPASLNETPSLSQKLSKVFSRIFVAPDRWVGLVSRGAASALDVDDQVVAIRDRHILGTIISASSRPGRYRLTFVPVGDAPATAAPIVASVAWAGGDVVLDKAVPPGLYAVTVSANQPGSASGREGWVLLTDADHLKAASSAFSEARTLARAWGPGVPAADVTRFLHAYLGEIAASIR
jgi:hypothetical protein